jgi:hypothetical protein
MCPVLDVVAVSERLPTTRKATALVAMLERAPQRRRNRAGSGRDFGYPAVGVVPHHQAARIACQALRRSSGNACGPFEHRLARRIGVREHRGIDVNDHLITFCRSARLHPAVQSGLCDERERVGLLLLHSRRFRRAIDD